MRGDITCRYVYIKAGRCDKVLYIFQQDGAVHRKKRIKKGKRHEEGNIICCVLDVYKGNDDVDTYTFIQDVYVFVGSLTSLLALVFYAAGRQNLIFSPCKRSIAARYESLALQDCDLHILCSFVRFTDSARRYGVGLPCCHCPISHACRSHLLEFFRYSRCNHPDQIINTRPPFRRVLYHTWSTVSGNAESGISAVQ